MGWLVRLNDVALWVEKERASAFEAVGWWFTTGFHLEIAFGVVFILLALYFRFLHRYDLKQEEQEWREEFPDEPFEPLDVAQAIRNAYAFFVFFILFYAFVRWTNFLDFNDTGFPRGLSSFVAVIERQLARIGIIR